MRTLLDIPEKQIQQLNDLSAVRKVSRAELVRQAIDAFLEQNRAGREPAFGIWRDLPIVLGDGAEPLPVDGLAYQERVRSEW